MQELCSAYYSTLLLPSLTIGHEDLLYPLSLRKQLSKILDRIEDAVGTIPWAVDKDLDEAGLALARLQYVYRLDTQDLMNGVIGTVFFLLNNMEQRSRFDLFKEPNNPMPN